MALPLNTFGTVENIQYGIFELHNSKVHTIYSETPLNQTPYPLD